MTSSLCHLCGICPGQVYSDLSSILRFPVPPSILSFPLCTCCLDQGYGSNGHHIGRVSHLPEFSVEFEIAASSQQRGRALALLSLGYLRTSDATVSDEYKSPIYHSLDAFRFHLPTLDTLGDLVTYLCGTHLHVAFPAPLKARLTDFQGEIFGPLAQHWSANREETERFWGRATCYYASDRLSDAYPCIRMQSQYDTIEFRLPRFRTATQYVEVVRFCRRVTYSLRRSLTAYLGHLDGARSPHEIGQDLLEHYQATVERQVFWQERQELRHYQQKLAASLPARINAFVRDWLHLAIGA